MFMQIAIGAIGIGIVLMLGYIVLAQVRGALPTAPQASYANPCLGRIGTNPGTAACSNTTGGYYYSTTDCVGVNLTSYNTTPYISCANAGYVTGVASAQTTVFAGFGLIAVGIIVLAAFGLINIFK